MDGTMNDQMITFTHWGEKPVGAEREKLNKFH